ncbi:hypothetical protein [Photorhabdus sp. SF281]
MRPGFPEELSRGDALDLGNMLIHVIDRESDSVEPSAHSIAQHPTEH